MKVLNLTNKSRVLYNTAGLHTLFNVNITHTHQHTMARGTGPSQKLKKQNQMYGTDRKEAQETFPANRENSHRMM